MQNLAGGDDVERAVVVVDRIGDVLADGAFAGGELAGLEGLQLGGEHRAGGVEPQHPHQLGGLRVVGRGGHEEADIQQRLVGYRDVVYDLSAAVDDGNHAVVRLADEHRHILVARAGELNGVAHLVVVDEAAPVVEDVQVVARPCDDALFGRVVVGVGADLIAPLVAAGRRDAVQRRAVIKNHAVAEGRHVLAERRADARHAADALARRASQRIDDAHDQHPDEREDQDRHADSALYGVLLFIFLLFLIVIHPVGVKRGVCAGEIGDAPIFSIHVSILSRKENAGLPPELFFWGRPRRMFRFSTFGEPTAARAFSFGHFTPQKPKPKRLLARAPFSGRGRRFWVFLGFSASYQQTYPHFCGYCG